MVTRTPSPDTRLLVSIMAPAADRPGFWGRPTSTLDWCEENYAVSFYIAEFSEWLQAHFSSSVTVKGQTEVLRQCAVWVGQRNRKGHGQLAENNPLLWCTTERGNTVSNLIMILPPIYGAIQTVRDGLEIRYVFAYLGLTAVGIGSWCFHMTLQYEMQLLDELPMIYSCCVFVYCLYECFKQKSSMNYFPIVLLLVFSVLVTVVYLQWKEPVFHQVMYGILVACLVLRSVFIVTWVYPWLRPLSYTSLSVFMMGFVLWNIDNIFCDTLREARQRLPAVVGAVTQFHAWWHILTGLGSYLHILFR
ncbi:ACER3 ceramidase, partial [Atractosteus spatula]|nr:ACER3 ceramidase [Atractosteus spatula]